jgi:hypothetical protein
MLARLFLHKIVVTDAAAACSCGRMPARAARLCGNGVSLLGRSCSFILSGAELRESVTERKGAILRTWNTLIKKNHYSLWESKLTTIYQDGKLTYALSLHDAENHEEALAKADRVLVIEEDGFVFQEAKTKVVHLCSRAKALTRVKVQFLDALEFVVDEIAIRSIPATEFACTKADEGEIRYPIHYEVSGSEKRKKDISEKAVGWDLFLLESLD